MPGLHIGKLAADAVAKDEEIKKDMVELRKTAEQMVCGYSVLICLPARCSYSSRVYLVFVYSIKSRCSYLLPVTCRWTRNYWKLQKFRYFTL